MSDLDEFDRLGSRVNGLCVVSTLRADAMIQSSLVNAGVLKSPLNGVPVLAFVTYGKVKLANLRARPQLTATVRSDWQWTAVEGTATLIGPDDPAAGIDAEALRLLLRAVFVAAGGSHEDWDAYDHVMLEQRRTAVLVSPTRIYGN